MATDTGQLVLRSGGNAVEAMIAMAATIAVVYPHMNAIGGDSFWIVKPAGKNPIGIDACGAAASGPWNFVGRWRGMCRLWVFVSLSCKRWQRSTGVFVGILSSWSRVRFVRKVQGK